MHNLLCLEILTCLYLSHKLLKTSSVSKILNLYNKIAPKNFKLIPQTHIDESNPSETTYFYKIEGFDKAILHSPCHIVQNKHFIQDRARGEMLINPDSDINPKLASQKPIELILKCEILD